MVPFVKHRQIGIFCDAGKKQHTKDTPGALSGVLAQRHEETEHWLPIQFASRVLTSCETRYCQTELEALSIRFSCSRFSFYITGAANIQIYTDCLPLVTMFNKVLKTTPPRILRMVLAIQELDYVVVYRKGKLNIADFLSRNAPEPDPTSEDQMAELSLSDDLEMAVVRKVQSQHSEVTMNTIRQATIQSEELQFLIRNIRKGSWKRFIKDERIAPYKSFIHEISEVDQIIYKGNDVIIIPESLTHKITKMMHELGHQGDTNLTALIKQYFYYISMHAQIHAITQSCPLCQRIKISKRKEPYGSRPLPARPFTEISLDHKTLDNGWYVLVILDIFSRYPDVAFVKSTSFEATREPLIKYFSYFSTPLVARSDNGPPFSSERFHQFSIEQNFQHDLHTPRSPQANAEVERVMATIGSAYQRAKISNPSKWREEILDSIKANRCTPHPALGMSPYEVLFGRKMRPGKIAIAPWISENPPEDETRRFRNIENKLFDSKESRRLKFETQRNVKEHDFRVGVKVLVMFEKSKLKKKLYEPELFQVTFVRGSQITCCSILDPNKIITRHSTFLKHFIEPIQHKQNPEYHDYHENDEHAILDDDPGNGNGNEEDDNDRRNELEQPQPQRNIGQAIAQQPQPRREVQIPEQVNERRGIRNPLAFVGRHLRSRGPAPEIPNVLPAAPEYSNTVRRELQEIHDQHGRQEAEAQNNDA